MISVWADTFRRADSGEFVVNWTLLLVIDHIEQTPTGN